MHSRWLQVGQALCTVIMLVVVAFGFWARFSSTGLLAVYGFLSHTKSSGAAIDQTPWVYSVVGLFVGGLVLTAILTFDNRRHRGTRSVGVLWLGFTAMIGFPILGAVIGHYFA